MRIANPYVLAALFFIGSSASAAVLAFFLGGIPGTDRYAISRAEHAVSLLLKDPFSTRFTDITVSMFKYGPRKGQQSVCGKVNAKNGDGAYAGFQDFVSGGNAETSILRPIDAPAKADVELAGRRCGGAVIKKSVEEKSKYTSYYQLVELREEVQEKCSDAVDILKRQRADLIFRSAALNACGR